MCVVACPQMPFLGKPIYDCLVIEYLITRIPFPEGLMAEWCTQLCHNIILYVYRLDFGSDIQNAGSWKLIRKGGQWSSNFPVTFNSCCIIILYINIHCAILNRKTFPHCLVRIGYMNGLERDLHDFTTKIYSTTFVHTP